MPLTMGVIPLLRRVVLVLTTFFSLIVLGISGNATSQLETYYGHTVGFASFALAVGVISFLTLPVLFVVDLFRRGAFTSKIVVELPWLALLCILWLASGATVVGGYNLNFPLGCTYVDAIYNGLCQQTAAVEAFAFMNFIILLFYVGFLGIMTTIAASRGSTGIWFSSVKESFGGPVGPAQHGMTQYSVSASAPPAQAAPQQYPGAPSAPSVQPQYTGVPVQSPQVTGQAIPV